MAAPTVPSPDQTAMRDFYKVLVDTRNLEINLFWQRSNYFLVLNTGIAFGFFNLKEARYIWTMALFGLLASLLWVWVALGAKFWQARWEHRLHEFEREHFPHLVFFGADESRVREDATRGLDFFRVRGFKHLVYKTALRKPSVSYSMILLSLLFVLGWLVLIGTLIHFCAPQSSTKLMMKPFGAQFTAPSIAGFILSKVCLP